MIFKMLFTTLLSVALTAEPFAITVTDPANGWPVPLVELRTTDGQRFVSDNAGVIAIDAPDLMGREQWFHVIGHGYGVKKDGFGYEGVRLKPTPGGSFELKVTRSIIAERVGRLTGRGLFAESQKCGREKEWKDSPIVGCDSVQTVMSQNQRFWFWGDTTLPGYPLGIFDMLGATSKVKPFESLKPPFRPSWDYVADERGKPVGVAKMPGHGPTWVFGVTTLKDDTGQDRIVGTYTKIENHLSVHTAGLCVWDAATKRFQKHKEIWTKANGGNPPVLPDGHANLWTDESGQRWLLFGNPFPHLKCEATWSAWQDPAKWEKLSPPKSLKTTDGEVAPHTGSIAYHAKSKRWVAIFNQKFGTSPFGEIWYAEAKSPLGPWGTAVKVLTHSNYTFYNPKVHVDLGDDVYFEGTYTAEFAKHAEPTPRHNYNQILYRLDRIDPRLVKARVP